MFLVLLKSSWRYRATLVWYCFNDDKTASRARKFKSPFYSQRILKFIEEFITSSVPKIKPKRSVPDLQNKFSMSSNTPNSFVCVYGCLYVNSAVAYSFQMLKPLLPNSDIACPKPAWTSLKHPISSGLDNITQLEPLPPGFEYGDDSGRVTTAAR